MADVKWIKIMVDIFDDEKIFLIEQLPEADSIVVIWFKLLCLAGKQNNKGVFTLCETMPFTDEMFAAVFRRPLNTVRLALSTFQKFGMVEIVNGTVTIPNWGKHQNIEGMERRQEYMRNYMNEYRQEQKKLAEGKQPRKCLRKQSVSALESSVLVIDSIDNTINTNTINTNTTSNSAFDAFWNLYPKKIGKGAALKKWQTIKPEKALIAKIMNAVREQMTTAQWTKEGGQYIPNPTTWLNQGRWDDKTEINIETTTATPAGKTVRAQQYDQRVYAESDLSGVGNELSIADVLKDLEVLKGEGGK